MKNNSDSNVLVADLHTLADDATELARRALVEPAQEKANQVATTVRKKAKKGKAALKRDKRKVEKELRRHPLEAVAIAFGAGLVTGLVFGKLS
ncbi:MAG: hypothetical protein KDN19_06700 [Verrucomicrobiae bacterium]|nr:hypothetical protein [Verrucomicrobiae bacterium]